MMLIQDAYSRLFPDEQLSYSLSLKYSGKFSDFNANVKKTRNNLEFALSHKWKGVSSEIVIGLIQELLIKILNKKYKKNSDNMKLYQNFIRNLHISAPKEESDPIIELSFNRNNEKFFHSLLEKPNLVWGLNSSRKLATYDYHTDTISVSQILKRADSQMLDYVIYHEMLHKSLKFKQNSARTVHHDREFKQREKLFPENEQLEKDLSKLCRKARVSIW